MKLLGLIQGSQGTLLIGEDRIVYRTGQREESRTWRFSDIENIASAGRTIMPALVPESVLQDFK